MVTRGRIRANGVQLANYLLTMGDNEKIEILEIKDTAHNDNLKRALYEMSVSSELTRTNLGLYHAQICPGLDDKKMSLKDWVRAADILEEAIGFQGQKRAIVLHTKCSVTHAHVIWERYNHEKGRMISNKFSRLQQDKARIRMEQELNLTRTPDKNLRRSHMRDDLTRLWQETGTGAEFINKAAAIGYRVAAGTQRPFMVVDETGCSYNLARHLKNVRTAEIRKRFEKIKLQPEKKVIASIRARQREQENSERQISKNRSELKYIFSENKKSVAKEKQSPANDNLEERNKPGFIKMSLTFEMQNNPNACNSLLEIVYKAETENQKKGEEIKQRLKKARLFRENERDI